MGDLKPFQIATLIIFAIAGMIGLFVFATYSSSNRNQGVGDVEIWGSLPQTAVDAVLSELRENDSYAGVSYRSFDAGSFDAAFTEALAEGRGPDLIFLSQEDIVTQRNRVLTIPFSRISERAFRDTFIEEGELFLTGNGILALPAVVDPLVMYWNRNLFSAAAIARPPQYWDEFYTLAPKLTVRDTSGNVTRSAVALGESHNIAHAKDILSAVVMQGGNAIVSSDSGGYRVTFESGAAEAALLFFTEFANPGKSVYSWNRALPLSRDAFLGGDLAVYFGYASELFGIRAANPNLNFDVASFPVARPSENTSYRAATFGTLHALSVARGSDNIEGALSVAQVLSGPDGSNVLSRSLSIPPARRDLLASEGADAVAELFRSAALLSRGWLDPAPAQSDAVFADMIESVTTGRARVSEAVKNAHGALRALLPGG
jgi:ABC-type glycerol-3-phosphate transport system substrate-binding protein